MAAQNSNATPLSFDDLKIQRSDFPKDFIFGTATSAYQVEGAWATDGKGRSNWDVFTKTNPDKIHGGANGCVAINQYNLLKEDVKLIKKLGFNSYRFSISWTRVLPGGRLSGGVNREGIKYYNDLIDSLLLEDITPCATIFHWDLPQCLEDEYGGFLSPRIVDDFCEFAELCFWEFGDRVKHWITLNEPWSYTLDGYVKGRHPPGRGETHGHVTSSSSAVHHRSLLFASHSSTIHHHRHRPKAHRPRSLSSAAPILGNPGSEPYIAAHNLILSHAAAVDIYRQRYEPHQGGKIGMTNVGAWFEPLTDTQADKEAASRALDFMLGWFVAPMVTGDYPPVMRDIVGDRLPTFTPEQTKLVKGSYDFLGINYYTANYASNHPTPKPISQPSYDKDKQVLMSGVDAHDNFIGPLVPLGDSGWIYIVPQGIHRLLIHLKESYNNPPIYITENGVYEEDDPSLAVSKARIDPVRIKYHNDHLFYVKKAVDEGANVKGYFAWSMFDNFEWADGYSVRFGLVYIDYVNGDLTRTPKTSAIWFMNFLNKKAISSKKQAYQNEEENGSVKRLRST